MPSDLTITFCTLDDVADQRGTVVVIDVLRAFTTAAVGLAASPASYELVGTVATALQRRKEDPATILIGEVDALKAEGFDHGNSPWRLTGADLVGRPVVHRSSAGTQGVLWAVRARRVLTTSFAVAAATAAALRDDTTISFCVTGAHSGRDGEEDRACGEYVAALLDGDAVDPAPYLARVAASDAAQLFLPGAHPDLPPEDVDFAVVVDRFDFAMQVNRTARGRHILEAFEPAQGAGPRPRATIRRTQ